MTNNIFSPPEISTLAIEQVKREQQGSESLQFGIPWLDEHFVMNRPGKFIGLLADTSHGKSTFLSCVAKNMTGQLKENEIGVFITWEDSVESYGINSLASHSGIPISSVYNGEATEQDLNKMIKSSVRLAQTPLYIVGHSEADKTARPRLTITDVQLALENLINVQEKEIRFVVYDYLQQISTTDSEQYDTRMKYSDIVSKIKDLALGYSHTAFVASQIGRKMVGKKWKMPTAHSAMETAAYEFTSDAILALWFVHRSENWHIGDMVQEAESYEDEDIIVTPDLMLFETLKQKRGKAGVVRAVDFVPEYAEFVQYNTGGVYRERRRKGMSHKEAIGNNFQ